MTSIRKVTKAILPVAGLGTRFLPATKALPKEMLTVVDTPLVGHAVEEARRAGIEEFIFVSARGKTAIEDHFDSHPELERELERKGKTEALKALERTRVADGRCAFIRQQRPLGLGHAVWCARRFVHDEPFAVILPDDLVVGEKSCIGELLALRDKVGPGNFIGVEEVDPADTRKYGIMDIESRDGAVLKARGFVEKPLPEKAPSNIAAIGRYVLEPEVLDKFDPDAVGVGGEAQLTDMIAGSMATLPLYGVMYTGLRYDCGSKAGFVKANVAYAMTQPDIRGELEAFLRELLQQAPHEASAVS